MHYLHTTLYVTDLDASVSFLENWTGLKVLRRFSMGDAHFAFLSGGEGETAVELIQGAMPVCPWASPWPTWTGSGPVRRPPG